MVRMQRIKQELFNVLALRIDFSGIKDDQNNEGQSTDSEKSKQIRTCNFQHELVCALTESIPVFFKQSSLMVAEKPMKQCIKTHCSLCRRPGWNFNKRKRFVLNMGFWSVRFSILENCFIQLLVLFVLPRLCFRSGMHRYTIVCTNAFLAKLRLYWKGHITRCVLGTAVNQCARSWKN